VQLLLCGVKEAYVNDGLSEVALLRRNIKEEIEAMQRGFSAFAAGGSRHEFIRSRMARIGDQQDKLAEHVGEKDASTIVCELYIDSVNSLKH
jgi:hypothetical protein